MKFDVVFKYFAMKVKITLLSFLLVSCISVRVSSDYDKSIDFTLYKTYAFYKKGFNDLKISDLDKRRIMGAIKRQLEIKGMTFSKTPDVYINVVITNRDKVRIHVNNSPYYFGWYDYNPYWDHSYAENYREGSLFIDIIDAKKEQLVWQGKGTKRISENIAEKATIINEVVQQIMAQFPPQREG